MLIGEGAKVVRAITGVNVAAIGGSWVAVLVTGASAAPIEQTKSAITQFARWALWQSAGQVWLDILLTRFGFVDRLASRCAPVPSPLSPVSAKVSPGL